MHARRGRAFVREQAMFIRPPKNRAIEILHVRETGRTQASSQFGGAITDCAIGNNRHISSRAGQSHFRGSRWIDPPGPGKMTHAPLLHCPHVEKHRRRTMLIFQPTRQFARRDPLHLRELVVQRGPQQKPLKRARFARAKIRRQAR